MNSLANIIKSPDFPSMSSLEISKLCEKRHDHVIADIRNMLQQLNIQSPEFLGDYRDSQGRQYPCFNLPKDLCLTLVSGYNVVIRKRIIDRWLELEDTNRSAVPQSLPEALRLAADMAEQNAALEYKVQQDAPKVAFVDHYVDARASKSLRETAKILCMPEKAMIETLLRDKALFRQSGNLLPESKHQRNGLFTVKTGSAETGHNFTQTRVTAKGIQWIADRYASELMVR